MKILTALLLITCYPAHGSILDKTEKSIILSIGDSFLALGQGAIKAQKSSAVQLTPITNGVQVLALKTGVSQVRIGQKVWNFQILSTDQRRTKNILEKWVKSRLGLAVKIDQAQVSLQGRLIHPEDWLDLLKICQRCVYTSELELSAEVESSVKRKLEGILAKKGLPSPSLRWSPEGEWVISKDTKFLDLKPIAARLGLRINTTADAIDPAPMVRTQIYVMEVRREKTRQWGIEWPDSVTSQIIPKFNNPISSLSLSAHALEKSGEAKILANPTLLCRSGQEAEFLAGGEFPIKIFNRNQGGVIWRKYGILVKVKPKADRFGKMSLSLETEVSNIDGARTVDGIPGLLTNRVLSHFDLDGSQTIAISGLIRRDESQSLTGLPGLSKIPILGNLFSSKEFRDNQSELVILVKPETLNLSAGN